jgi:preprotein translocase subunit SecE
MAVVEAPARPSLARRVGTVYQDVRAEMVKGTWPDRPQVQQLTIAVIVFSLVIGGVIAILDILLQLIFVRGIPSLLGR